MNHLTLNPEQIGKFGIVPKGQRFILVRWPDKGPGWDDCELLEGETFLVVGFNDEHHPNIVTSKGYWLFQHKEFVNQTIKLSDPMWMWSASCLIES